MPSTDWNRAIVIAGPRASVELLADQLQANRLKPLRRNRHSFRYPPAVWRARQEFDLRSLARAAGLPRGGQQLRTADSLLAWRLECENGGLRLEYVLRSPNSLPEIARVCRQLVLQRPEIACVCAAQHSQTLFVRSALITATARDTYVTPRSAVQRVTRRQARRWGGDRGMASIARWNAAEELLELAAGRWDSLLLTLNPPVSHFWDF